MLAMHDCPYPGFARDALQGIVEREDKAESYRGANTNTQSTFFDDTLEFSNLIVTADEHADFEFYGKWVMGP